MAFICFVCLLCTTAANNTDAAVIDAVQPCCGNGENADFLTGLFAITWTTMAPVPSHPVSRVAGVWGSDGLFHLICGNCQADTSHPIERRWNPAANTWSDGLVRPGGGVHNHDADAIDDKVYVGGGNTKNLYTDDFTVINLTQGTWTVLGQMPVSQLLYYEFASLDGKIYMFGGATGGTTITNIAYVYDTVTASWSALATMPAAMRDVAAGGVGDTIYIAGGCTTYPTGLNTLWKYSVSGNNYTAGASIPAALFWAVGFIAPNTDSGPQFMVLGGQNGSTYLNSVYRYNIQGGYWATETPFATARRSHAGAFGNGCFYVSCGYNGSFLASHEQGVPGWPTDIEEGETSRTLGDQSTFIVSPNPCRGILFVHDELVESKGIDFSIYDISGKLVKNLVSAEHPEGLDKVKYDIRDLKAGVYFLKITADKSVATKKFILVP